MRRWVHRRRHDEHAKKCEGENKEARILGESGPLLKRAWRVCGLDVNTPLTRLHLILISMGALPRKGGFKLECDQARGAAEGHRGGRIHERTLAQAGTVVVGVDCGFHDEPLEMSKRKWETGEVK